MIYDLNVPWAPNANAELQRTVAFLDECKFPGHVECIFANNVIVGYDVIALTNSITGAIPSKLSCPIPEILPFPTSPRVTFLRRCTLHVSDPSQNHRIPSLLTHYDLIALRPTTEKAFLSACTSLSGFSIISLDLTVRHPFHFRPKPFSTALGRGLKFEICYSQAVNGSTEARRNFIANCQALVRATRGRGLIVSSEAKRALGVRAPADVINLLAVWGLGTEKAVAAMGEHCRSVLANEKIARTGFRGIVDVVEGGERLKDMNTATNEGATKGKASKIATQSDDGGKRKLDEREKDGQVIAQMSKRQQKKQRLEGLKGTGAPSPSEQIDIPVQLIQSKSHDAA